jgi:hypothetical protein
VWQLALVWLLRMELFPEAAAMSLLPSKIIVEFEKMMHFCLGSLPTTSFYHLSP